VFLTLVGSKTYALLSGLIAPAKPATKTYADLKAVLRQHLKPKPLVIVERFEFHRRVQKENETVDEYMAELRTLAVIARPVSAVLFSEVSRLQVRLNSL